MFVKNNRAFTLIELLVVVLIIGILSAIALPQYQKAVIKARAVELQTLTRALATAQAAYFMANGEYSDSLGKLDLSFPFTSATELAATFNMDDGALNGEKSAIAINKRSGAAVALFASGPYAYKAGFYIDTAGWGNVKAGELYCMEMGEGVDFCQKFYGGSSVGSDNGGTFYTIR